ncbi:hypothetical protein LguiA_031066 [Lonicera macranthoides]
MRSIKVNNNKVNKVGNNKGNEQYYSWESLSDSIVTTGDLLKWPPRSYTCSFCKREFKSAQALGGHMNVHRKDRARQLTKSPLRDNHCHHNININAPPSEDSWISPRSPSSSPSKMFPSVASTLPPLVPPPLSSPSPPSPAEIKKCVGQFKKDEIKLGLDLETGLFRDLKGHLDLELRLGCS